MSIITYSHAPYKLRLSNSDFTNKSDLFEKKTTPKRCHHNVLRDVNGRIWTADRDDMNVVL